MTGMFDVLHLHTYECVMRYGKVSDVNEDGQRLCLNRPKICSNYNECTSALCILALC